MLITVNSPKISSKVAPMLVLSSARLRVKARCNSFRGNVVCERETLQAISSHPTLHKVCIQLRAMPNSSSLEAHDSLRLDTDRAGLQPVHFLTRARGLYKTSPILQLYLYMNHSKSDPAAYTSHTTKRRPQARRATLANTFSTTRSPTTATHVVGAQYELIDPATANSALPFNVIITSGAVDADPSLSIIE